MIDVSPDISFIENLKRSSGSDLSTCMQCGSCTAACGLSDAGELFPRKEIIWASWGQKDLLMKDRDLWLCHQCGDCTVTCPRGVRPGDILANLRKEVMLYYARPGSIARMINKPAFFPVILGFPVLIISMILIFAGTMTIPPGEVDYSKFFPHAWLNISFTGLFLLSVSSLIFSIRKFWSDLSQGSDLPHRNESARAKTSVLKSLVRLIPEIFFHKRFSECEAQRHRYLTHLAVFWGFIILLVVTFFAILSTIFFSYPLGILNPIKIAGNLGGMVLMLGAFIMISKRLVNREKLNSEYSDWFFPVMLLLLGFSGFLVEGARFHNWSMAYHMYFVHLVLVWLVILYLPYTKFAHFVYRIIALVHAGRLI